MQLWNECVPWLGSFLHMMHGDVGRKLKLDPRYFEHGGLRLQRMLHPVKMQILPDIAVRHDVFDSQSMDEGFDITARLVPGPRRLPD